VVVRASHPYSGTAGWEVTADNLDGRGTVSLTVEALCLRGAAP
jgi:hypothetical protein